MTSMASPLDLLEQHELCSRLAKEHATASTAKSEISHLPANRVIPNRRCPASLISITPWCRGLSHLTSMSLPLHPSHPSSSLFVPLRPSSSSPSSPPSPPPSPVRPALTLSPKKHALTRSIVQSCASGHLLQAPQPILQGTASNSTCCD